VQRTDGGKPRRALKEELDEEKPRKPFDPRAEVPVILRLRNMHQPQLALHMTLVKMIGHPLHPNPA